eukprot:6210327-Pleurochrysis_carterae.AAC.2
MSCNISTGILNWNSGRLATLTLRVLQNPRIRNKNKDRQTIVKETHVFTNINQEHPGCNSLRKRVPDIHAVLSAIIQLLATAHSSYTYSPWSNADGELQSAIDWLRVILTREHGQSRQTPVRCTATAVALRVAAHQHGAFFEASYQRQNELTKQHTKHTAADNYKPMRNLET